MHGGVAGAHGQLMRSLHGAPQRLKSSLRASKSDGRLANGTCLSFFLFLALSQLI
jgi:hypothetical protein